DVASPYTLYLFTADHGHVYADAKQTLYLNERFPELPGYLTTSHTRNPIYPNGSPRDVFLHLRPERREEVLALLTRELHDLALVMPIETALAEGLFGTEPACAELGRRG